MTDKEIALALGVRILVSNLAVHNMNLELQFSRDVNALRPLTLQVVEEARKQILQPAYSDKIEELSRRLDEAAPDAMLQTLRDTLDELLGQYNWDLTS